MPGEFRPSLPGERRGGRAKGTPNKADATIKEMVVKALHGAGGVQYLISQAHQNPVAFMGLVGKVLPLQLAGHDGGKLVVDFRWADAPATPLIEAVADETSMVSDETTNGHSNTNGHDTDSDDTDVTFISDC